MDYYSKLIIPPDCPYFQEITAYGVKEIYFSPIGHSLTYIGCSLRELTNNEKYIASSVAYRAFMDIRSIVSTKAIKENKFHDRYGFDEPEEEIINDLEYNAITWLLWYDAEKKYE